MNAPSADELAARVAELELKLADAEDTLEAMNLAQFRQQQQIDRLLAEVLDLRRQVQAAAPVEQRSPRDEIPPHY